MTWREALAAISLLGAGELLLARATSGPLPFADVAVALVGWAIVMGLARWRAPRAVFELATLSVAAHVALPPSLAATGPAAMVALAAALIAGLVATRDVPATTVAPWAIAVATLIATVAGPAPAASKLAEGLLGVAVAWLIAVHGRPLLVLPLAAVVAVVGIPRFPTRDPRPDVVVVTVDALRADTAAGMKAFRRIAAKGRAYEAWAPAPWTLPSLAGLLTGVPAHANGAGRAEGDRFAPPSPWLPRLPELVAEAGYRPMAYSAGNPFTGQRYGLLRGFKEVWHPWEPVAAPLPRGRAPYALARPLFARLALRHVEAPQDDADAMVDRALRRLRRHDRPRFLWLHLTDTHLPYDDPPCRPDVLGVPGARAALLADPWWSSAEGRACLAQAYAAAAAKVDAALLRLLDGLDLDRTIVVLTSDHGEALGEVGFEHGHTLEPEVTRVPLAIHAPYRLLRGVAGPASLTDVGATLLSVLDAPPTLPGHDLTSGTPVGPTVLSGVLYGPPRRAVVDGPWMLVDTAGRTWVEAWQRPVGQREAPPTASPAAVERLAAWLPPWPTVGAGMEPGTGLKELGYVE